MRNRSKEGREGIHNSFGDRKKELAAMKESILTPSDSHSHLHPPSPLIKRFDWKNAANLVFCALGILISYFYFGIIQEKM